MKPLASRYRPVNFKDFVGQRKIVVRIQSLLEANDNIPSMIFWGPPGVGKTTLAHIISNQINADFYTLSAVNSGKKQLLEVVEIAERNRNYNKGTVLFLDEIHRWDRRQQDGLLPYVEEGIITLIGATTEHPGYSLNKALLSRCEVYIFAPLSSEDIVSLLKRVLRGELDRVDLRKHSKRLVEIAQVAHGDARTALNLLEEYIRRIRNSEVASIDELVASQGSTSLRFDTKKDKYEIMSALHKSVRASDVDASLYWLGRLIVGGEDPLYIARRLIRIASEDIGMADPNALSVAVSAFHACEKMGLPECDLALAESVVYLASAPKSNHVYSAMLRVYNDIKKYGVLPVPLHLRNPVTSLDRKLGFGKGYVYDHDLPSKKSGQQCLPTKLKNKKYYE